MLSGNGDQNVLGKVCLECGGPWERNNHRCPRNKNDWDPAKAKAASEDFKQKRRGWTANNKPHSSGFRYDQRRQVSTISTDETTAQPSREELEIPAEKQQK